MTELDLFCSFSKKNQGRFLYNFILFYSFSIMETVQK